MKYFLYVWIVFLVLTGNAIAAGKTGFAHITVVQPSTINRGTYITNCPYTRNGETINYTPCITTPKCGPGVWFFITESNNPLYSTLVSLALTSSTTKTPVRIVGNDSCSSGPYEDVLYIYMIN